jgi:hypothetical protein
VAQVQVHRATEPRSGVWGPSHNISSSNTSSPILGTTTQSLCPSPRLFVTATQYGSWLC